VKALRLVQKRKGAEARKTIFPGRLARALQRVKTVDQKKEKAVCRAKKKVGRDKERALESR